MKNKFFNLCLLAALTLPATNLLADELTGDTRLACEAILCLSTATRPAECAPSLKRFYSIVLRKPWKTAQARRAFLNLCPTGSQSVEDEKLMEGLKGTLSELGHVDCSIESLNKRLDIHRDEDEGTSIRISKKMPQVCASLNQHEWTDLGKPKYICDGRYYPKDVFNRGYFLREVSKNAYFNLPDDLKGDIKTYIKETRRGDKEIEIFYKKDFIDEHVRNRQCWVRSND